MGPPFEGGTEEEFRAEIRSHFAARIRRSAKLVDPRQRSLILIASLAGFAAGAVVIVILSLHGRPAIAFGPTVQTSSRDAKPSVFGMLTVAAPPAIKLSPGELARTTRQAIVRVSSYDASDQPIAERNGFVYSADGMIVTSFQAVRGAASIAVETASGEELHVISIMASSPQRDLAILAVSESKLPALAIDAAAPVEVGDRVSAGASIASREAVNGVDVIHTTAAIPVEMTGGPLLNEYGKVIAIATGANSAVPARYIPDLLGAVNNAIK